MTTPLAAERGGIASDVAAAVNTARLDELGNIPGCDVAPTESLCEVLLRVCRENAPRPALCQLQEEAVPWVLSYQQLLERVYTATEVLQQRYNIQRGSCVALCVHEQHELVVLTYAIPLAGAHFVPLDTTQPITRLRFVLRDTNAALAIGHPCQLETLELATQLEEGGPIRVQLAPVKYFVGASVCEGAAIRKAQGTPQAPCNALRDCIYVQYTSGSTGTPKAVVCEHSQLVSYAQAKAHAENIDRHSRVLLASAFTFDPCQGDIAAALYGGAALCLASRSQLTTYLADCIRKLEVTHICTTPALWNHSTVTIDDAYFVKVLTLGGEPMSQTTIDSWADHLCLRNVYGVTECTVYQSFHTMRKGDKPNQAGTPFPNCVIQILDPVSLERLPMKEIGEICLGGPSVARGYLNRPTQQEASFIQHPQYGRLYRTGDRGRWDEHGCLRILGRADDQVKVNGIRVELREIELQLQACSFVKQIAAVVQEGILSAFLVVQWHEYFEHGDEQRCKMPAIDKESEWAAKVAVEAFSVKYLAPHMIPRGWVILEALPLSANGKVAKRELPLASSVRGHLRRRDQGHEAMTKMERAVAKIWGQELRVSDIGPTDYWTRLGGDSLIALRAVRMLRMVLAPKIHEELELQQRAVKHGKASKRNVDVEVMQEALYGNIEGTFSPLQLMKRPKLRDYSTYLEQCGIEAPSEQESKVLSPEASQSSSDASMPPTVAFQHEDRSKSVADKPQVNESLDEIDEALLFAAGKGMLPLAQSLIEVGANPNTSVGGLTALHAAAACGGNEALAIMERLIANGANLRKTTGVGLMALHIAAGAGFKSAVELLVAAGSPISARDINIQSVLHHAARSGDVETITCILELSQGTDLLEKWDKWGRNAMHWVVLNGHLAAMRTLLSSGCSADGCVLPARVTRKRTHLVQETPLELAIRLFLTNKNASSPHIQLKMDHQPARLASVAGNSKQQIYLKMIKLLVAHGAGPGHGKMALNDAARVMDAEALSSECIIKE